MRNNLYVFRAKQRMTQEEFAKETGVSRATYSFIERGERGGTATFWANLQKRFCVPDEKMWALQKVDEVEK